jgi:hypothetical protein
MCIALPIFVYRPTNLGLRLHAISMLLFQQNQQTNNSIPQSNNENRSIDQPIALATPLQGSSWPFFKFTDEIEDRRMYFPFSV